MDEDVSVNSWMSVHKMNEKNLYIIVGPTAIGKTAISIEMAQYFNCPILSFDSRQFYKEMSIGTAKPTKDELAQAEHHFIGNLSIHDHYTAGIYEKESLERLSTIFHSHNHAIAVGGSGLYIDALAYGIDDIPADETIRKRLQDEWQEKGLETLSDRLLLIDPEYHEKGDMLNSRRVIRALEAFEITGIPYSKLRKRSPKQRSFKMHWIGLNIERERLFDRINQRVIQMMAQGLLNEVENLLQFRQIKALKTVGYREFFGYFDGEYSLDHAIALVQRNTRHYAKRQITWFQKNPHVKWYGPSDFLKIIEEIKK